MTKTRNLDLKLGGQNYSIELREDVDPSITKDAGYVMKSYLALAALKKGQELPKATTIAVYSAKIPMFRRTPEGIALFAAFIEPSPDKRGEYWLIVDERLSPEERLATISHEFGHIAGGYHPDEKNTQKTAIQTLTNLVGYYDKLSQENVKSALKREARVNFDVSEKTPQELKAAIEYLVKSGKYFGLNHQDWRDAGLTIVSQPQRRLERMIGLIIGIFGALIILSNPIIIGNVIIEQGDMYATESIIGALLALIGILLINRNIKRNIIK